MKNLGKEPEVEYKVHLGKKLIMGLVLSEWDG